MLVSMEHPGSVPLVSALSVGFWDMQSLSDKDGGKVALCKGAGKEYAAKHSWEDRQTKFSILIPT